MICHTRRWISKTKNWLCSFCLPFAICHHPIYTLPFLRLAGIMGLVNQATVNFFSAVLVATHGNSGPHNFGPPPTAPLSDSDPLATPQNETSANPVGSNLPPGARSGNASNGTSLYVDPAAVGPNAGPGAEQLLDPRTGQLSDAVLRVVEAAKLWWSRQLGYTPAFDVRLEVTDLPAGQLGWA